tara:strand:+ start:706263 stop:706967 length:705 start_codon:yes stop_codon:yes gene_type:complete
MVVQQLKACIVILLMATVVPVAQGANNEVNNFSRDGKFAKKHGVFEIALRSDSKLPNPFDVPVKVTFTPPSGAAAAKTVDGFFDGEGTWRARVYVNEVGSWKWSTRCEQDSQLNAQSGEFDVADSDLRGRLLVHPRNQRHWITEDGRWFLNLNDTAYFLLLGKDHGGNVVPTDDFRDYVRDLSTVGITSVRTNLLTHPNGPWDNLFGENIDGKHTRLNLKNMRRADERLEWMLN